MHKIKVLFLTDKAAAISGPHRRVVEYLNAITSLDEVEVLLFAEEVDSTEPFAGRLKVHVPNYHPHSFWAIAWNLQLIRKYGRKCDIVFVSCGLKNFLYGWLSKNKRRKFVAGPDITPIPLISPPTDPNYIMTVRMVDTWIEASDQRGDYTISGGAKRDEFVVLRSGLDLKKFSPKHRDPQFWLRFGLHPTRPKIIFAAARLYMDTIHTTYNRKSTEILLDAFATLSKEFRQWDLILVGNDNKGFREEYQSIQNAHFIGPIYGSDIATAFASADIGCIPSTYESFCYVGAEMFASGLAIVSSKVGVMIELIEDGVSGILCDLFPKLGFQPYPDAAQRLSDALTPLMADIGLRQSIGIQARLQAEQKLSTEIFAQKLLAVFKTVLAGRRTPWPVKSEAKGVEG